jgi:hypothetical protein
VIIFATGCGPTNPATQAGVLAAQNSPLANAFQIKIGGVPAVPAGDQSVELIVNGVPNAQNLVLTVGQ